MRFSRALVCIRELAGWLPRLAAVAVLTCFGWVSTTHADSTIVKEIVFGNDEDLDSSTFDYVVAKKPFAAHMYEFVITYEDDGGPDDVLVVDTLPAEWIAVALDGIPVNGSGAPGSGIDKCGEFDQVDEGDGINDGTVDIYKNGKGRECQSATTLEWEFDATGGGMFALTVAANTRPSPGKGHKHPVTREPVTVYAPTSCGPLYLNDGAVAYDAETLEWVAGPTEPLCLAVVDQELLDALPIYTMDADHDEDSLSSWEEACLYVTDPCLADTDGDGVRDDVDLCPLWDGGVCGVDSTGCSAEVPITLGDDDSEEVALDFDFPFNGSNYNTVWVNSNGNLTFGSGNVDWSETVGEFLNGQPRIAPLWEDLNPPAGGTVSQTCVSATETTVAYAAVPEFSNTGANTFSVTLRNDGTFTIVYGAISAQDGLAGATEGGGATNPGESDLSADGPFPKAGTTYEHFTASDNDLNGETLEFDQ